MIPAFYMHRIVSTRSSSVCSSKVSVIEERSIPLRWWGVAALVSFLSFLFGGPPPARTAVSNCGGINPFHVGWDVDPSYEVRSARADITLRDGAVCSNLLLPPD